MTTIVDAIPAVARNGFGAAESPPAAYARRWESLWDETRTEPFIIAGPCSAESAAQVLDTAVEIARIPAVSVFRAGVWKQRTRLGSFEGAGASALEWLKRARDATGLPVAVEVTLPSHVEQCLAAGIDVLWIGARTSVNPILVRELAESMRGVDVPVLVKNPVNPEFDLWIGALERFSHCGVSRLAAIHRGFSTIDSAPYRNAPLWEIPRRLMSVLPDLPLLCDPSHIAGDRAFLFRICETALDQGFHGLMIEAHFNPEVALSDAGQQLRAESLAEFIRQFPQMVTK